VGTFEVREYAKTFGTPSARARAILETQAVANEHDIVGDLESKLGSDYAGVWFDNDAGEFVVPTLRGTSRAAVVANFRASLTGDFRIQPARYGWEELEAAQEQINEETLPLIEEGLVQTALDPRANAVVVEVSSAMSNVDRGRLAGLAASAPVAVEIREMESDRLEVETVACRVTAPRVCDKPLRGGVDISFYTPLMDQMIYANDLCSAGFKATGKSFGNRFILTAGHCVDGLAHLIWGSETSDGVNHQIGPVEGHTYPGGDWAAIKANGSFWDTSPWPSMVAHYWEGQERQILNEARSYVGQYVCHSGQKSGTSCGNVILMDKTATDDGLTVYHTTEFGNICARKGDSGGPVFAGNVALGLLSSGDHVTDDGVCDTTGRYLEITEATDALGVTVAPRLGTDTKPVGTTTDATNVSWNQATGNGIVEPKGLPTTYYFQWGTTTSYGQASGSGSAGSGWNATAVSAKLGYLVPGTTYHYRLVTTNSAGTTYGPDKVFYSSRAGVFFSDAGNSNSMTRWGWDTGVGWKQEFLYGHAVAAGTKPATMMFNGTPHVFYVDASNGNTITDWTWNPTQGWNQVPLWGGKVAPGTSPAALVVNGVPHVFFVDANNNRITAWRWNSSTGWQQFPLYGNQVAAGTSPSAIMYGSDAHVFYVDASNNNTITDWNLKPATGWQQIFFYGHKVAAGTSPTAIVNTCCIAQLGAMPQVYFVDASNNNSISGWTWHPANGWQQAFLYGHPVAAGTSPDAMMNNNTPHIAFVDASNNNTITDWTWNSSTGWQQSFLWGRPIAAGTSPEAVSDNNIPNIYFVDASNNNTIVDWTWNPTTGWQQVPFGGHSLSAKSSPGAF
jgi:hypothetical protein